MASVFCSSALRSSGRRRNRKTASRGSTGGPSALLLSIWGLRPFGENRNSMSRTLAYDPWYPSSTSSRAQTGDIVAPSLPPREQIRQIAVNLAGLLPWLFLWKGVSSQPSLYRSLADVDLTGNGCLTPPLLLERDHLFIASRSSRRAC